MNSIEDFVLSLSKKRNTSVIKNPYLNPTLANNLRVYLNAINQLNQKPVLLVGEALQSIFQIDTIIGVGNKGAQCAQKSFPDMDIRTVRHPSYGGKRDFIQGLDAILFSKR